ncbi:MAG: adenosine kinase [Actinobacteria bacterium]|nr:adenosine kinase [Actinomycetota bacterium]
MNLVDIQRSKHLHSLVHSRTEMSGGSAANTAYGLASLGGKAGFIGKISAEQSAAVVLLEGYLFDKDAAKDAFRTAAEYAHAAGRKVALTLSDSFCVDRHRSDFLSLVKNDIDILFSNEDELKALYQVKSINDGLHRLRDDCEFAAVTRNEHGSVVIDGDEVVIIDAEPVDSVVDATGAGDMYAAGFLYGFVRGKPIEQCGKIGSIVASEVITHMGPRPLVPLTAVVPTHLRD